MKLSFVSAFVLLLIIAVSPAAQAQSIDEIVAGKILLDVEQHGEAWYVDPVTYDRYYLRDGDAAYAALESFGLGITDTDLMKIPIGVESRTSLRDGDDDGLPDAVEASLGIAADEIDTDADGYNDGHEVTNGYLPWGAGSFTYDTHLASRLEGRILLQVESHGEAWYVYPEDHKRYYLGNGEAAYEVMRYLGLGITSANLAQVAIASTSPRPPISGNSSYDTYSMTTSTGTFSVKVITMRRDAFTMVTDTGNMTDCEADCAAQPLASYITENSAFAGIHGSYFCPPDYSDCAAKTYSYLPPVFNSALGSMLNDDTLIFHDRPIIARTADNELHYFHRASDFGDNLADYEAATGNTVAAAIGNWPSLIEDGVSVVSGEPTESAFANKSTRGGIGWDDEYYYLVIASSASVTDLASVFEVLGAEYAINLDGGGSSAMYYNGSYKIGPGRLLPNAIVFTEN